MVSFEITALACKNRKVLFGTSIGSVGIIDSESCNLLDYFDCHRGAVQALLIMPHEIESYVCAEIPFLDGIRGHSTWESDSSLITTIGKGRQGYEVGGKREFKNTIMTLIWKL